MSYDYGKQEVCAWVRKNFDINSTILDMGAFEGTWHNLLPEYKNMDAVEIFEPSVKELREWNIYRNVYLADARTFEYDWYDLVIFGDIVEHMTVEEAQKMLEYAKPRCRDMIVAVPFLYPQGIWGDNPYQIHIQDDLTPELFDERYPGFKVLCRPTDDYCYYHKKEEK